MYDVVVIGCGITGAAIAYQLSRYQLKVAVLEGENDVAQGATKANSAILHAGYDPEPGSLMARLNVRGVALAKEICEKLCVPRRETGSLVLAFSEEELPTLQKLYDRGVANGVEVELLSAEQAKAMEPSLSGQVVGALHAPTAACPGSTVWPWRRPLSATVWSCFWRIRLLPLKRPKRVGM